MHGRVVHSLKCLWGKLCDSMQVYLTFAIVPETSMQLFGYSKEKWKFT